MQFVRGLVAVFAGGVLATSVALPAGAGSGPLAPVTKAKNACTLLTNKEITSIFTDAPLDPGPTKVKLRKRGNQNFTQCEWDDKQAVGTVIMLFERA
jgi:hypothetical protein